MLSSVHPRRRRILRRRSIWSARRSGGVRVGPAGAGRLLLVLAAVAVTLPLLGLASPPVAAQTPAASEASAPPATDAGPPEEGAPPGEEGTTEGAPEGTAEEAGPTEDLAAEVLGLEEDAPLSVMLAFVDSLWARLAAGFAVVDQAPQFLLWLELQSQPEALEIWGAVLWQAAVAVGVGFLLRWGVARLTEPPGKRVALAAAGLPPLGRWMLVPLSLLLNLLPVAAFALGVNLTLPLIEAEATPRLVAGLAVNTFVAARALHIILHFLLLPPTPALALVTLRPKTAESLYASLRRIVSVVALGLFTIGTLEVLGMPSGALGLISRIFGLIAFALVMLLIRNTRRPVATWLRARALALGGGGRAAKAVGRLAEVWHILAVLYVTALFLTWFLEVPGGFQFAAIATAQSVAAILAVWVAGRLLEDLLARLIASPVPDGVLDPGHPPAGGQGPAATEAGKADADPDAEPTPPPPAPPPSRGFAGLRVLMRGALTFVAVLLIIEAWGGDTMAWVTSGPNGGLLGTLASILITLAVALLVWEGVVKATDKMTAATDAHGNAVERSQRIRTLVPLARTVVMILLIILATLVVLSELGVNIAPLLAGAGVLGLAISFGSQKLVQDVITGAFCLIEDALAVGDVVNVGGHAGVVEALSIRSIRLRDLSGTVHTIPFSTVGTISNMTKDFSFAVMDIGVAYREDTDHVCRVLQAVDRDLRADRTYGPEILEPLEILGVDAFADSAVIIKARLKTKPIKQWYVGREFNRRMKKAFDAEGIEIPFPHTTLYFGVDRDGSAPPAPVRFVGGGAAAQAAPEPMPVPVSLDKAPTRRPVFLPDPDGEGEGEAR